MRVSLSLGGLAAFGLVAAHCFAYVLTAPNAREMSLLMHATEHRYWGLVMGVALGVAIGVAVASYVRILHTPGNDLGPRNMFLFAAPRLGAVQLIGFAILEASERALWGAGSTHPLEEPAVMAGFALQILVAVAAALILSLATRLAALIAKYLRVPSKTQRAVGNFNTRHMCAPRIPLLAGGAGARAPPPGR
jgi:hypothetical protein